jgi:hypothetical protein
MLADTAIDIRDIRDSGSLSSLILKGNELANSEAGAALGSMLKTCTSLTALDVSENAYYQCDGPGFASEIASGLKDAKGSLSNLHIGQNEIPEEQMRAIIAMNKFDVLCAVPVKELKANSITELDLSGKSLGIEGALVLSTHLPEW